jgi:hypothetical protein
LYTSYCYVVKKFAVIQSFNKEQTLPKNGNENGQKMGADRNEKGQFVAGWAGGPGSGHRRQRKEISEAIKEIKELLLNDDVSLTGAEALDPLGRILLNGTLAKDAKVRTDSAKLYFTWLTKRVEAEQREQEESGTSPEEIVRIRQSIQARQSLDVQGVEDISDLRCPHCGGKFVMGDEVDGDVEKNDD